jgi:arginine/ornithine N-succinyltransferase beta subunit
MECEVEATLQVDGKVGVDYPWYSFLVTKPDTERIRNTLDILVPGRGE